MSGPTALGIVGDDTRVAKPSPKGAWRRPHAFGMVGGDTGTPKADGGRREPPGHEPPGHEPPRHEPEPRRRLVADERLQVVEQPLAQLGALQPGQVEADARLERLVEAASQERDDRFVICRSNANQTWNSRRCVCW